MNDYDFLTNYDLFSVLELNRSRLTSIPKELVNTSLLDSIKRFIKYRITIIKYLDISYNQIQSIPESINNLIHIESLNLESNNISCLPESFGDLTSLHYLSLNRNKITILPESIGNLTKLRRIHIQHNELTGLPESFGSLISLKELWAGWNTITSIPMSFTNLYSLELLQLNHNQLNDLPNLVCCSNLCVINLNYNMFKNLPSWIWDFKYLQYLQFEGNKISALPEPQNMSSLLHLTDLYMGNNLLQELPFWLEYITSIKTVTLDGNPLTPPFDRFLNLPYHNHIKGDRFRNEFKTYDIQEFFTLPK